MKKRLAVNVDHVATLRQARGGKEPDPVAAAAICELAGADGIVAHLREDRRHMQDRDIHLLMQTIKTKLIFEMAATAEMIGIALAERPHMCTLVPERRQELTTEGGLNVAAHVRELQTSIGELQTGGILVSLFIDPDKEQIRAAREAGADFIEIHTGAYCDAVDPEVIQEELKKIQMAAREAAKLGMGVNAGHGINYWTVKTLREIPEIEEFSIGHTIMSRAILVGLDRAVREMAALING